MAEQRFEIGEIAIICNAPLPGFDGKEVEIIGPLTERTWTMIEDDGEITGLAYQCRADWAPNVMCLRPRYLRKRKSPDEPGSWLRSVWKPEKSNV